MANAATTSGTVVGVATVILILVPGLALNIMFLFMYGRRSRLRVPVHYFLVSLAVCNIICLVFWIASTLIAQFGSTVHLDAAAPKNGYCLFQAILLIHYQSLHMHTYCLIAFERVLKFWKPTLHTEIFYNDIVVMVILVVMWLIELIPALFHVMTWGVVIYETQQYQCAYDDSRAPSRLNAMLAYTYIIPFVFTLICFIVVYVKYSVLKNKVGVQPGYRDDSVIEEDLTNGGRSFRKSDPRERNVFFINDDSDEEEAYNSLFAVCPEDTSDKDDLRTRRKIYKYRAREVDYTVTIIIIWAVFIILWLCYLTAVYTKTYSSISSNGQLLPAGFETAATFLSHLTLSVCPCFYWASNRRFRRHLRLACNCVKPKEPKPQKIKVQPIEEPVYRRGPISGPQMKNIHREGVDWD